MLISGQDIPLIPYIWHGFVVPMSVLIAVSHSYGDDAKLHEGKQVLRAQTGAGLQVEDENEAPVHR
jgi:hypothetical protein